MSTLPLPPGRPNLRSLLSVDSVKNMTKQGSATQSDCQWWDSLERKAQLSLLSFMYLKGNDKGFVKSLINHFESGRVFSPKQCAAIRKWARPNTEPGDER